MGVQPVRILIVDELQIFRDGLRLLLASDVRLQVVGDAGAEAAATALVRELRPDILLLGSLPSDAGQLDMLKRLAAAGLPVRTILLVKSINAPDIVEALRFGACGVVPKDAGAESLLDSLEAVAAGLYWIGERVAADLPAMIRRFEHARNDAIRFGLTRREVEVVRGVVTGESNRQIAARLRISDNTVKRHLVNVYNKVGASTRVELALFAVYHRLIDD